jgi:CBS domain containing-hemolysin-like protein
MLELLLVVTAVLMTSAICSLFEAVLYSVPVSRIEALERAGSPTGHMLKELRRRVDRPIAAVLSLNTIANTGGGAIAGALAAQVFGGNIWLFSCVFTLAILVFSEVLPKTIGVVYARGLAPWIARPLQGLVWWFRPLITLTQHATKLVWSGQHEQRVSDDELLTMVGLGLRSGDLQPHEARVIRNVLAFERRTAAEVMTPRTVVFTLEAQTTVGDAAQNSELEKYSRVPVFEGVAEDLVGVVHKVDILKSVANDQFDMTLTALMRPIHFVVDTTSLDLLLRGFLERRQHAAAVINEFGSFTGLVTLEDVLEELLGREIVDEFDQVTDQRAFAKRRRAETLRGQSLSSGMGD